MICSGEDGLQVDHSALLQVFTWNNALTKPLFSRGILQFKSSQNKIRAMPNGSCTDGARIEAFYLVLHIFYICKDSSSWITLFVQFSKLLNQCWDHEIPYLNGKIEMGYCHLLIERLRLELDFFYFKKNKINKKSWRYWKESTLKATCLLEKLRSCMDLEEYR